MHLCNKIYMAYMSHFRFSFFKLSSLSVLFCSEFRKIIHRYLNSGRTLLAWMPDHHWMDLCVSNISIHPTSRLQLNLSPVVWWKVRYHTFFVLHWLHQPQMLWEMRNMSKPQVSKSYFFSEIWAIWTETILYSLWWQQHQRYMFFVRTVKE